jgi:predicted S18 family serine protease
MKNDWIKIKNYYIHHSISLEALAKKFKVSPSAVNKHCRLEKWVELKEEKSQEIDKKVAEKIEKSEVDRKAKTNEFHNELYNKGLEVANMLLDEYIRDLKEGKKKTKANAYNLDFIMKAIANAQKGQRLSLNIDKEDVGEKTEPEITYIAGLDVDKI